MNPHSFAGAIITIDAQSAYVKMGTNVKYRRQGPGNFSISGLYMHG